MDGTSQVAFDHGLGMGKTDETGVIATVKKQVWSRVWMVLSTAEQSMQFVQNVAMAALHLVLWAASLFSNEDMSDCVTACVHDSTECLKMTIASIAGIMVPVWGERVSERLTTPDAPPVNPAIQGPVAQT